MNLRTRFYVALVIELGVLGFALIVGVRLSDQTAVILFVCAGIVALVLSAYQFTLRCPNCGQPIGCAPWYKLGNRTISYCTPWALKNCRKCGVSID